jgi:hypothetical protein
MPDTVHRMVWAEIDLSDPHALVGKSRDHPIRQNLELLFGEEPSSNTRLIGYDDDCHSGASGSPANIEDAVDKVEILDTVNVIPIFVDDTVPVQKQRPFHS